LGRKDQKVVNVVLSSPTDQKKSQESGDQWLWYV